MHAVAIPAFRRKRLQHCQVVLAECAEDFKRVFRIALAVLKYRCPRILIEWLNRGSARADDQADPPTPNDLRVGQMGEDLRNRPLPRVRLPFQLLWSQSVNQFLQLPSG